MINLKSKKNQNIVSVLFLLFLLFVGNYYLANPINNKVNREINNYTLTNVEIPRTSGHWNLTPFVIDDSGGGDYTWEEASGETWCSGSGTLEEPYLIENVTIDGGNLANCITIKNSDKYFRIENCTVFNSGSGTYDAGIYLYHVEYGTLINNNCSFNNRHGIITTYSANNTVSGNTANNNQECGIYLSHSNKNTVSGNTVNNNQEYGRYNHYSDNATVSGNTVNNNQECGIYNHYSDNATVSGNTANNNSNYGIYNRVSDNATVLGNTVNNNYNGIFLYESDNATVLGNTANNNSDNGIFLYESDNNMVSGNTANNNSDYGIFLFRSNSTTVSGNTANNNSYCGIDLYESDNATVLGNTVNNNNYGIYNRDSDNATVLGNIIDNNMNYGIVVTSNCYYNLIYKNYFINNGIHALDQGNFNDWNSSIIGNYWDNYIGIDADKNGIGDTPHVFNGGTDYLPIYDQAPLITINLPVNGTYWNTRPTINIEATDTNLECIWYEVSGQRSFLSSGVGVLFDNEIWLGLPEGAFIIEIYANDSFGQLNDAYSLFLYKDTTPPVVTINSPIQDQGFIDAPTFSITIMEANLDTMWYVIVSEGTTKHIITSTTGSIDLSVWNYLADGTIKIRFYANDTAGNEYYLEVSIVKYADTAPTPTPGIPGFNVIITFSVISLVSIVIIKRKKKLLNHK